MGISPYLICTKFCLGEGVPELHIHVKFQHCMFENVSFTPKIVIIANFWYKFTQKGYIPLSNFYEMWCGGGSPKFAPSRQISPL